MTLSVGGWLLALVIWLTGTLVLRSLRRWMLFYLWAAFGFVLLVASGSGTLGFASAVENLEARQVALLALMFRIGVEVVNVTGLAIPNHTGWAVFDIGLECSAILEMAAIVGLTAFYPAFLTGRRLLYGAVGLAATWVINLLRILLIVAIINQWGTGWVFAAHAVFGRVFFFACTVALYWFLMTRPTMRFTGQRVAEGAEA